MTFTIKQSTPRPPCRTFQHSLDVRGVALNSEVILTADENSDIFVWDAKLAIKRFDTQQH